MFLFIDNYDSFSYNIVQYFMQLGQEPVVICNDDPRLLELATSPELEKVVLSPGPSCPENAGYCLEFLARLPHHIPVLGVCLGHQCLGHFGGCPVVRGPKVMHGKTSEIEHGGTGLYKGIPSPMTIGRYHSLVVKCEDNHPLIEVTARDEDGEVMSLRYKDRPWVGVQFHPESILTQKGLELLENFPKAITGAHQKAKSISPIIDRLANGENLTQEEASGAFAALMDGELTPAQAGGFLLTLRAKGETAPEMAAAIACALERAKLVEGIRGDYIDIVGTGGDGKKSFNCSTATALTMAGLGYKVVKHGNRAISSSSGAGDALEGLGYPLATEAEDICKLVERTGFAFQFAPHFHPCFKHIGPIRNELGVRTLFNMLGPLINPSKPTHIMLGVAKAEMVEMMAQVIALGNYKRALVICGAGGYDEATAFGAAKACLVVNGKVESFEFDPADFGFATPAGDAALRVENKEEALAALKEILTGKGSTDMMEMVALNVGLAMHLFEPEVQLKDCFARARRAVQDGVGSRVINNWN